jgi:DNA-binding NtrC family response regulator
MRFRILFISGHSEDVRTLSQMLDSLPLVLDHAEGVRQARTHLNKHRYGVVLTDSILPDGNWLDILDLVRQMPSETQLIVTDPQADARFWSEALNMGAYDLLTQPFYEPEVRRILYNACTRSAPAVLAAS